MKNEIRELMAMVFEIEPGMVPENPGFTNIDNWDSIHHLALIEKLEEKYNLSFAITEYGKLNNMESIIEIIISKL